MHHQDMRISAEAIVHGILRLTADFPARFGRIRTARIVVGRAGVDDDDYDLRYAVYTPELISRPTIGSVVELVDALLAGELLASSLGPRPTVVLTRGGFRALDALEAYVVANVDEANSTLAAIFADAAIQGSGRLAPVHILDRT